MNALLCSLLLLLASGPALAQDIVGNGGDTYALEFVARGYKIVQSIKDGDPVLDATQLARVETAVADARVETVDGPLVDLLGATVDALTVDDATRPGHKMIQLDRERWSTYHAYRNNVYALVFHEYLRVAGIYDENYVVSHALRLGQGELALIRALPDGTYRGTGAAKTDDGTVSLYSVTSIVSNGYVTTSYRAPGYAADYATFWSFSGAGGFDLYSVGIMSPVAVGVCNDVQCYYDASLVSGTKELWTFTNGRLERQGEHAQNGVHSVWLEVLEK